MQAYSLYDLNEYIKRVIALNFDEPIWVSAEISQIREVRGQAYLDLVDHKEDSSTIIAQSGAVIWYKSLLFIKKKLGDLTQTVLKEGSQVLVKVKVEFNERYGFKLVIEDIDATYTIGQMQIARQKIIQRLKDAGIIDHNKTTSMPSVVQKIAVISSGNAAGYIDFKKQMEENSFGYAFSIDLFQASMQGQAVEREVVAALREISSTGTYDCVAIMRGGGSKTDLSYFDNYNIAHAISQMDIPVITGIGHDIDESVADIVSYMPLKTPTAVADYFLERNLRFESEIINKGNQIQILAKQLVTQHQLEILNLEQSLKFLPQNTVREESEKLKYLLINLKHHTQNLFLKAEQSLSNIATILTHSDPELIIKKGYAIIKSKNKIISSIKDLESKTLIEIRVSDGSKQAVIK